MSQPHKNENASVDQRNARCHLFEQQMDACLDGRDSISTLASDPHLERCSDCRSSFNIYRQFDRTGGTVLNGGGRMLRASEKKRFPDLLRRWLPLSSLAMAAALIIYVVASPPSGQSDNQFAASGVSNDLTSESSGVTEADRLESENDASNQLMDLNYLVRLRSAAGDSQQEPTFGSFGALGEVGAISQRWFSSGLVSSIAGKPSSGWHKPWQYTSELPGIRPFHQSVNVALVLYNDSMTVL